jgi:plastocyanin
MSNIPISNLRLVGRNTDFLDRKIGQRGEIFYDQQSNVLRLYDGDTPGGFSIAREDTSVQLDLSNVANEDFKNKATEAGISASTTIDDSPPLTPNQGELWFDTESGVLYVYYNDGDTAQWVQPTSVQYGIGGSGGSSAISQLTDVTISGLTAGQILKYNGTRWVNDTDATGGSGGTASNSFATISVTGQPNVVADSSTDTLTLVAGTGVTITTNESSDSITISASASAGGEFSLLSEVSSSSLTFDQIYLPAITSLVVSNVGASAYTFDQYSGNNPTVYAIGGTTIAFKLTATGHPFQIQDPTGSNYNTGLVHVSSAGVVSTGSAAQGKASGTLYWKVPGSISGNYRYQCSLHGAMIGTIVVKNIVSI